MHVAAAAGSSPQAPEDDMATMLEMPPVSTCVVRDCAYNLRDNCHARAITIGDGIHPACDTFLRSPELCDDTVETAGVGACKVSSCVHNRHLECQASAIQVGYHEDHPDCLTFEKR
jgi:hypothetical protein